MQCPRCQSDDLTRSRRKLWERFVLPVLRGQPQRCRDCKHRFWVGVEWGRVVLGALTAMIVATVVVAMVVIRRHQDQLKADVPVPRVRRRQIRPLPPGLPPLSSVHSPDSAQSPKAAKNSKQ